jgi:hypothetical protein
VPYLLAIYGLTLPAGLVVSLAEPSADLLAWLKLACLLAFGWHAAILYARRRADAVSAAVLAASAGLTWFTVLAVYLYKVVTMTPLVFSVAISSLADSRRTIALTLGEKYLALGVTAIGLLAACAIAGAWLAMRAARRRVLPIAPNPRLRAGCAVALALLLGADALYVSNELLLNPREQWAERPLHAPDYSGLAVRSNESVFILQLESTASSALFERAAGGYRSSIPLPGIETIVREGQGSFFPLFWANGIQTHRAQEAILCGISGNVGEPLSIDVTRMRMRTCLPAHLAKAGFATVFLYAYFDMEFFNFGPYFRQMGFQEAAYGAHLMAEGDPKHQWGYDDCVFYERAFDRLAKTGLATRERVFAYFEVGTNHWPFEDTQKHPEAHPYRRPATPLEHYRNSVAEQDHCLLGFWRKFRELGRDDVHLIIVPDHSVPVTGLPDTVDSAFGTWLAYVPPARRRAESGAARTVLDPAPSQAQIYPTVLELLGAARSPQSFAFALQGKPRPPDYDACQMLASPYQRVVAVRDSERADYWFRAGKLSLNAGGLQPMDSWDFYDRYFCR